MSTTTGRLALPILDANQASQEVPHNLALFRLDALLGMSVPSLVSPSNTPPGSPAPGETHLVGSTPTGNWSGKATQIAYYNQGWYFVPPFAGLVARATDTGFAYCYSGSSWVPIPTSGVAALAGLSDVVVSGLADNDFIAWDSATSKFKNQTRAQVGLGTAAAADTGTGSGNVPTLDGSGKLNTSTLPALAVSNTFTAANQAAMLALAAQEGDFAFRTDTSSVYILTSNSPTTLADWKVWIIDISGKQNTSEKNQVNGYAGLDSDGKINGAQIPDDLQIIIRNGSTTEVASITPDEAEPLFDTEGGYFYIGFDGGKKRVGGPYLDEPFYVDYNPDTSTGNGVKLHATGLARVGTAVNLPLTLEVKGTSYALLSTPSDAPALQPGSNVLDFQLGRNGAGNQIQGQMAVGFGINNHAVATDQTTETHHVVFGISNFASVPDSMGAMMFGYGNGLTCYEAALAVGRGNQGMDLDTIIGIDNRAETGAGQNSILGYGNFIQEASAVVVGSSNIVLGYSSIVTVSVSSTGFVTAGNTGDNDPDADGTYSTGNPLIIFNGNSGSAVVTPTRVSIASTSYNAGLDQTTVNYNVSIGTVTSYSVAVVLAVSSTKRNVTIGEACFNTGVGSVTIGYQARAFGNRVANVAAAFCGRTDRGTINSATEQVRYFSQPSTRLRTREVSLKTVAETTIAVPPGYRFVVKRCGVELTTYDGTGVTTQPWIKIGVTGNLGRFRADAITTALTAVGNEEDSDSADRAVSVTGTVRFNVTIASDATTCKGMFFLEGFLREA